MDYAFLVRVLHRLAHLVEYSQAVIDTQSMLIAISRDGCAFDQFHYEVGPTCLGSAAVDNPGNAGMVHHRQGLTFGLKACADLAGVHAWLDNLHGHAAADWLLLFGHEHNRKPPLADLLQQLIAPNRRSDVLENDVT